LVLLALQRAIARRGLAVLHHSDRGRQYTSGHYQQVLQSHGILCSMSGAGTAT
jgi:putative transposase